MESAFRPVACQVAGPRVYERVRPIERADSERFVRRRWRVVLIAQAAPGRLVVSAIGPARGGGVRPRQPSRRSEAASVERCRRVGASAAISRDADVQTCAGNWSSTGR